MTTLGVFATLVFVYGMVARRLSRWTVSGPMVFVAAGLVAAGVLDLGGMATLHGPLPVVAELALVLVLFSDAARIHPRGLRGNPMPVRLLLIGLPLSIGLGTLLAWLVLPQLTVWECGIVAAALAPTDAALGQAVITSRRVPAPVRSALNVESGLNDGGSVPFLMLFVALAAAEEGLHDGWVWFAVQQIGIGTVVGVAVGAAGGVVVRREAERRWTTATFEKLGLAALAVVAWFVAGELGGNGFIAAFVGGGAAGMTAGESRGRLLEFAEEEGQLLALAVFFVFGALATPSLGDVTWAIALYAALSLTVVRMAPVAVALLGLKLPRKTVAFVGWFGPRGLASIVLALVVVEEAPELAGLREVLLTVTVTVFVSVYAHGATALPLTRRLAAR